jgi:hypothetical protein
LFGINGRKRRICGSGRNIFRHFGRKIGLNSDRCTLGLDGHSRRMNTWTGWAGFDAHRFSHPFVSNIENMNRIFDRLFRDED